MVTPPPPPPMTDHALQRKASLPPACSCFFRGIEFEPSERVREEPPDDRNQKTKKPKLHGECWNSFGFLVFWFFGFLVFWFFGSLVLWFFGFLVVWFYCGEGYISKNNQKNKEPKNQRTKKPKNQKTKKPKNQRTKEPKKQKTKKPKLFQHSPWSFGFLVFWFRSSGGSSRTRSEGSNSITRKKQIDTYTNTKLTLIPR